jgi:hypothetical protein
MINLIEDIIYSVIVQSNGHKNLGPDELSFIFTTEMNATLAKCSTGFNVKRKIILLHCTTNTEYLGNMRCGINHWGKSVLDDVTMFAHIYR